MKTIVVTGSSGFIGSHLVKHLKEQGYIVHGADIVPPIYERPSEFTLLDLRKEADIEYWFYELHKVDEVYNLACLMGGMGYIGDPQHNYDIMVGSTKIVANVIEMSRQLKVPKSFFSSSACVYNMKKQRDPAASLRESDAYPAMPDLVYGWQKLFSEQMYEAAQSAGLGVRIARFHNIFGPMGSYDNGKEKAPAALCRKVAQAKDGDSIEVWGPGTQRRSFLYIDECIEGIDRLMAKPYAIGPVNIGSSESVTINELAAAIIEISGKKLTIKNVEGPEGVFARNSNNSFIRARLGWAPSGKLIDGLKRTYEWINEQVQKNSYLNECNP